MRGIESQNSPRCNVILPARINPAEQTVTWTSGIVRLDNHSFFDNYGHIDRERSYFEPGLDIGFRLWEVELRRQAPLPPVAEKEVEGR